MEEPKIKKKMTFREFLIKMDCIPMPGGSFLKLPDKKFLPLIEKELKKTKNYAVFINMFHLLSRNKIPDKTLKSLFEEICKSVSPKAVYLPVMCSYLIGNKRKDYCVYLKKILEKYGTKKYLVDDTYAFLAEPIRAAGELNCVDCYEKIDEIAGFGTKMNGRVLWSAQEALKKLQKEICSPKDFVFYVGSKKSLDQIKDAMVKKLKAIILSYHTVGLEGNRIELWYYKNYDPEMKSRQAKYLIKMIRTDVSRSADQQRKLRAKLEVFLNNLEDTYLLSGLFP